MQMHFQCIIQQYMSAIQVTLESCVCFLCIVIEFRYLIIYIFPKKCTWKKGTWLHFRTLYLTKKVLPSDKIIARRFIVSNWFQTKNLQVWRHKRYCFLLSKWHLLFLHNTNTNDVKIKWISRHQMDLRNCDILRQFKSWSLASEMVHLK